MHLELVHDVAFIFDELCQQLQWALSRMRRTLPGLPVVGQQVTVEYHIIGQWESESS